MKHVSPSLRFRAIIASAALAATLGPLAAHAQEPSKLNADTAAAIAAWRKASVALVDAPFREIVADSYTGQASTSNADWFSKAMSRRAVAEQTAFASLDPATASLITAYYEQADSGQPDSVQDS